MTAILPDQKPAQALPLERLKVRLRLRDQARFHFQHGGVIHGLLCRAFGSHLPAGLFPLALESGRVDFAPGDPYDFVLSAAGPSRALLRAFEPALRRLAEGKRGAGAATLDGNFELESVEPLALPSLEDTLARAEALAAGTPLRLVLASPLRLRRPPELAMPGAGYVNQDCFPAALLLDRLWRRYRQLADGEFPESGAIPALPPSAAARPDQLLWLDMPVRGKLEGKPGRPGGTTLGGVCGAVELAGLPLPWLRLLVLMDEGQLGSGTHFGFGRLAVGELPSWLRPARTCEEILNERAGDPLAVAAALLPAALAMLDEGACFFRRGLSRFSAEEGRRRARAEGFRHELEAGEVPRRLAAIAPAAALARLAALWPAEPIRQRLASWLADPADRACFDGLLSALFAGELAEELAREDLRLVRMPDGLRVLARASRVGSALQPAAPVAEERAMQAVGAGPERQPLFEPAAGLAQPAKGPLYLTDPLAQVRVDGEVLVVELEAGERRELPIRGLSHLVCLGRTRVTLPALWALAELGVPAYFCTPQGELEATFAGHRPDWRLWNAQAAFAADGAACLAVARELVAAKLHNAGLLVSRFELGQATAKALHAASREVASRQSCDEVLGSEGYGARLFFEALGAMLPEEWKFSDRRRQPPTDPVNAMLSFGYSLLHRHASTALQEAGLNPRIGIFHRGEDRYDALAADLQEELRWLVDALVIGMVRQREVKPADFEESRGGVWLRRDFRKKFVAAFEERLLTEVAVGEEKRCYREILYLQAKKLAEVVLGNSARYSPFRLRY